VRVVRLGALVHRPRPAAGSRLAAGGVRVPDCARRGRGQRVHPGAACSAIGAHHRDLDLPDPVRDGCVRLVRRGLRRTLGTAPRRPAHALDMAEITTIITAIDPTTRAGARDRALILQLSRLPTRRTSRRDGRR
jgi:hypothetical protein